MSFTGGHVGWTMKTSAPRTFSSSWTKTSPSENRVTSAWPSGIPRQAAISSASAWCAFPVNSFSSYGMASATPSRARVGGPALHPDGWGGRIRTSEYGIQSPAPCHLATPQVVPARRRPARTGPRPPRVRIVRTGPVTVRVTQSRHGRAPSASRIRSAARCDGAIPSTVGPLPDISAARHPASSERRLDLGQPGPEPRRRALEPVRHGGRDRLDPAAERRHQGVHPRPSP